MYYIEYIYVFLLDLENSKIISQSIWRIKPEPRNISRADPTRWEHVIITKTE